MNNSNFLEQPYAMDGIYYKPDINLITINFNELTINISPKKKRKKHEKNNNNKRQKINKLTSPTIRCK